MIRLIAWSTMTLLALGVATYAGAMLFGTSLRTSFVQNLFSSLPTAITAHLAGGLVAVALGAFQVNSHLRARFLSAHRWTGRGYVLGVIVGGTSGFTLALNSFGGLVTHIGFGLMAVCWIWKLDLFRNMGKMGWGLLGNSNGCTGISRSEHRC